MNIRPLKEADYPYIESAIKQRLWERSNKKWSSLVDSAFVELTMKDGNPSIQCLIIEETYLLLFSLISPWYTGKILLDEKLIFRLLDGPGKFEDVVVVLEHLAQKLGAAGIITGTLLAPDDRVLAEKFKHYGFEQSAIGLFKEIKT